MPQFNQDALKSVRNKKKRPNSRDPRQRNRNRDNMPDNSGGNGGGNNGGGGGGNANPGGLRTAPPLQDQPGAQAATAFGRQFDIDALGDLKGNPEALASAWMQQNGIDPYASGGMTKAWNDLSSIMPQLFTLTQGSGTNLGGIGDTSFLDYAGNFLDQSTKSSAMGGSAVDASVLQNLFNPNLDPNSALGQKINNPAMDAASQANTVLGLIGAGLSSNYSGDIGSAVMGRAQQLANDWLASQSSNGPTSQTFVDFLNQNGFTDQFNY